MPKFINHFPFFFLILTAITGIWMRFFALPNNVQWIPYDHILHGHSHAAILGWTFLAVLIIFIKMTWEHLHYKKQAIAIVLTTFVITFSMFIAFLWQGYALYSIILSTIHIGIEYWAIFFVFRSLKTIPTIPTTSRRFFKGALVSLFISSIGPLSLGAIASQGLRDSALFDMAIYFYLHFQYNGWLYLFLVGLFLYVLSKKGIKIKSALVTTSFWISILSLFPGYFLSILWYDFGIFGVVFAWVGAIGQLIGVLLICVAAFRSKREIVESFTRQINLLLSLVFLLLISKSVMELALLHISFAQLIYDTRAVVIGYLHLTFLGFISLFILSLYQMVQLLDDSNKIVASGLFIFLFGFIVNELVLFLSGLFTWLEKNVFHIQNELLFVASILLLVGSLVLWSSLYNKKKLPEL